MRSKILSAFGLAFMGIAGIGWLGGSATMACPPNNTCNANQEPEPIPCISDYCGEQNVGGYCIMCVSS